MAHQEPKTYALLATRKALQRCVQQANTPTDKGHIVSISVSIASLQKGSGDKKETGGQRRGGITAMKKVSEIVSSKKAEEEDSSTSPQWRNKRIMHCLKQRAIPTSKPVPLETVLNKHAKHFSVSLQHDTSDADTDTKFEAVPEEDTNESPIHRVNEVSKV